MLKAEGKRGEEGEEGEGREKGGRDALHIYTRQQLVSKIIE